MKIITHDHLFHADEVFAIATLCVFSNKKIVDCEIVRTRDEVIILEAQSDPNIWVLDVGKLDQPELSNFDHHQDRNLPASNRLVLDWFNNGNFDKNLYNELLPFFEGISNFDVNADGIIQKWGEFNETEEYRNLSQIISAFNRNPNDADEQMTQFRKAVEFAITVLENEIYSARQRAEGMKVWEAREEMNEGKVAVLSGFCSVWQREAKKGNVKFVVFAPKPTQWNVQSLDSNLYPLHEEEGIKEVVGDDLIFAHKGRFVAGFKTKESALKYANTL